MITQPISPWHWRSLPLQERTGTQIFEQIEQARSTVLQSLGEPPLATLLESPYPTPTDYPHLSRYSIAAWGPRQVEQSPCYWTPTLGQILSDLRSRLTQGQSFAQAAEIPNPDLPFTGGWLGWLGYDLAWEIEALPRLKADTLPYPVALWYEPDYFCVLDHHTQVLWIAASHPQDVDRLADYLSLSIPLSVLPANTAIETPHCIFHSTQEDYESAVQRAKSYIQAGDIFQANLSLRFSTQTSLSSWALYRRLQQINPSPFASYWRSPWGDIASCSPERLVQLRDRTVQTRPIAGTRPRGISAQQDLELAQELLSNVKERAEHIMLVDLERNDLGRVCRWGSVQVDELLSIERYSHVMHLVSNVTGQLNPDRSAVDVIQALFPGGTITGCPKVRCMEIIEALERDRRSLFYGSCGYIDWRGFLDLNILIRTLLHQPHSHSNHPLRLNTVWGQVGAGIVADSNPAREWQESLQKAQAQLTALQQQSEILGR